MGVWLALACALLGCSSREELPSRPKPVRGVAQVLADPGRPTPEPLDPSSTMLRGPDEQRLPANQAAPAAPSGEQPDAGTRDFPSELVRAFGDPASCLSPRPSGAAPSAIVIALATQVMPSGAVGHSEVSGAGLDPQELGCLRRRLDAVHFSGPIVNAPFPVRGNVTLNRRVDPSAPAAAKNPGQPVAAPTQPDQAPAPLDVPTEAVKQSPEPINIPTEAVKQAPEPIAVPTDPVPQP